MRIRALNLNVFNIMFEASVLLKLIKLTWYPDYKQMGDIFNYFGNCIVFDIFYNVPINYGGILYHILKF